MIKAIVFLTLAVTLVVGSYFAWADLGKYEPLRGCYLGAYVDLETEVRGDVATFQKVLGKDHATFLRYVGYGKPFPRDWVATLKTLGGTPCIAWEPNEGLDKVQRDDYLKNFAIEAGSAGVPIFLRFASEMNGPWTNYSGDAALYKEKFRIVSEAMKRFAPNVALVWTVSATPYDVHPLYYPGDEWVDWVGIDIYSVPRSMGIAKEAAGAEDPRYWLDKFYKHWASRKPIAISEFAAAYASSKSELQSEEFACDAIARLYGSLPARYPRVKAVFYFSMNTIAHNRNTKNYSLIESPRVRAAYSALISSDYFLSHVGDEAPRNYRPVKELPMESNNHPPANGSEAQGDLWIHGIRDGSVVVGKVKLNAVVADGRIPRYVIFYLDGAAILVTNRKPFDCSLKGDSLTEGPHTLRFDAVLEGGSVLRSPDYTIYCFPSANGAS